MNIEEKIKSYISLMQRVPEPEEIADFFNMNLIEINRILNIIFVKLVIAEKRGNFENNR